MEVYVPHCWTEVHPSLTMHHVVLIQHRSLPPQAWMPFSDDVARNIGIFCHVHSRIRGHYVFSHPHNHLPLINRFISVINWIIGNWGCKYVWRTCVFWSCYLSCSIIFIVSSRVILIETTISWVQKCWYSFLNPILSRLKAILRVGVWRSVHGRGVGRRLGVLIGCLIWLEGVAGRLARKAPHKSSLCVTIIYNKI